MTIIVPNSSDLNQKKVLKSAFQEWTTSHELAFLMGTNEDAVIQTKIDTSKGSGDTMFFSLMGAFPTSGVVKGSTNLAGNEMDTTLYSDSVVINYARSAAQFEQSSLVNLRTPIEIMNTLRPRLLDVMARKLRDDILLTAKVTATPNRSRVLFGAVDSNFNATFATALGNIDSTDDKLTVAMLNTAIDKARNVGAASADVTSRLIRPMTVKMDNGAMMRTYVFLVGAAGARQLQSDTDWVALRDDNRKNDISMPFFNGNDYLGMVDGAMVYRVDAIDDVLLESGAGASSINVSHALLCGAQAFAVGIGQTGEFVVGTGATDTDYGRDFKIGYNTIRGETMLTFDGVEQGVVHVYHSAV